MPHAGTYVLACLISGVSAALILASGPSYTESRSPQGTVYNVDGGRSTYDGCQAGPCQIAYLNSVEDFCLWAPSHPALSATRSTEHTLVAWCTESVQGSRVIPDGTVLGAHLVITPEYVQITGVGKLTNINVPPDGVVSASGQSYSDHRIVVTSVYGQLEQISEWTSFVSQERFCFRACRPSAAACPQIHDIFGCSESVSGNYDTGVFEDCIVDGVEVPSALYQEILAAPSHRSAHPFSHCTSRGTISNAQIAHARRAIAPVLVTSLSQSHLSLSHSTPVSSCVAPTTTDTTTMPMTSSSFPTSTLNATSLMNFSVSSTDAPTFTMCSYNHTHTHTRSYSHSHTHRRSHHHSSAFSATSSSSPPSSSSSSSPPSSSSSYHSFSHSPSPRTTSSLNDSSSISLASSSPIPSTPSFTFTFHSSGPLAGTATPFVTSASTPLPTPSLPSSFYGTSSSLPGLPTPPSSYGSSTSSSSSVSSAVSSSIPSSTSSSISSQSSYILTFTNPSLLSSPATSPATSSSPVSPSTSSSTSSENSYSSISFQSSYILTFTTPSLSSVPTTSPASSPSPVSPSTSSSPSSSTSSQTSYVLPFTTSSSSVPTASPASSSPTVPNSQTQIGPQCPPLWNAGSVSSIPLPPLTLAILMIVISSSVGIVVF